MHVINEHRRNIDNPNNKSKPTTAAENFLSSPNHTANDMQLIPTEKIVSNRDSIRRAKAREAFLIQKGRTIDPNSLNIREETVSICFLLLCSFIMLFYCTVACVAGESGFSRETFCGEAASEIPGGNSTRLLPMATLYTHYGGQFTFST